MTIGAAIGDPLRFHGIAEDKADRERRVAEALERVGLAPASQFADKYPTDLSGGQKQRAVLARAIILGPDVLVADEPVSMLDMSVRAKILELMIELKSELDLTYVYITHDLATAKFFCDRIAIMYLGRIVELGPAEKIYADPKHPYTQSLLRAIPEPDPRRSVPRDLPRGEIPDAVAPPLGCRFHPRCPKAFEVCGWESRDLRAVLETRWTTSCPKTEYEAERELIGDLDALDEAVVRGRAARRGRALRRERRARCSRRCAAKRRTTRCGRGSPRPRWSSDGVEVRFHERPEPRRLEVDGVEVECHLHDPEAIARARALPIRGPSTPQTR